mgnify:CR=1 FL=1
MYVMAVGAEDTTLVHLLLQPPPTYPTYITTNDKLLVPKVVKL